MTRIETCGDAGEAEFGAGDVADLLQPLLQDLDAETALRFGDAGEGRIVEHRVAARRGVAQAGASSANTLAKRKFFVQRKLANLFVRCSGVET